MIFPDSFTCNKLNESLLIMHTYIITYFFKTKANVTFAGGSVKAEQEILCA